MPASRTPETSRRRRGELSRERIVEAAVRFIDRQGLDELSMRRLAAELGAGTMTLYGYFRDKDELLDAVVDSIASARPPSEISGTWRERLRKLFLGAERNLNTHPGLVRLRLERPIVTRGALRLTEAGMTILEEAGFERTEAAQAFRALFIYTFGSAAFNPPDQTAQARTSLRTALAALPRDEYPRVTAAADELEEVMDPRAQFVRGLDLLLDGIEQRLTQRGE